MYSYHFSFYTGFVFLLLSIIHVSSLCSTIYFWLPRHNFQNPNRTKKRKKKLRNHFDQKTNFEQSECVLIWLLYNFGLRWLDGLCWLALWTETIAWASIVVVLVVVVVVRYVCVYVCLSRTAPNTQYERAAAIAVGRWWNKIKPSRFLFTTHSGTWSQDSHLSKHKRTPRLGWMSVVFARYHRNYQIRSKETNSTEPTYSAPSN